ncbi:hypothetical protein QUF80_03660 [Desulfococcaceae bacterium HSG8]|nr:hypothetical protein [Desulfococcaceae bacterium HSG8]
MPIPREQQVPSRATWLLFCSVRIDKSEPVQARDLSVNPSRATGSLFCSVRIDKSEPVKQIFFTALLLMLKD